MKWFLKKPQPAAKKMSQDLGISEILAQLLLSRAFNTGKKVREFLNPDISQLGDLYGLEQAQKSYGLISQAIEGNKKITVYGDYDVDGIMSTVILVKGLQGLGARVGYYIPDRFSEGYGLNLKACEELKNNGTDLVICCDNGISAAEECGYIKSSGMGLIILDHHSPHMAGGKEVLPECDALIDMKTEDSAYGFREFCAGGLCYRFINGLYRFLDRKIENEAQLFIFAAIATICDMVELVGENRVLAHVGLRLMNSGKNTNKGLLEILNAQGVLDKPVTDYTVGFVIGPFINSAGRMAKAADYVDIFLSEDREKIISLTEELKSLSDERKRLTEENSAKALEELSKSEASYNVIVEYIPDCHESLAGLVAGRIKEKYNRPAIVITKSENACKGSGRSIDGYNMFDAINSCRELFIRYGGHSQAVGITIARENIDKLRKYLNDSFTLTEDELEERLYIDKELPFGLISLELCSEMESMKPFGKGCPEPLFATRNVFVKSIRFVGRERRFVQFTFFQDGKEIRGVSFSAFDKLKELVCAEFGAEKWEEVYSEGQNLQFFADIVYRIERNTYNGWDNVQLRLTDIRIKKQQ